MSTILSDFLNRIFFSQTWTDVSKNSSKTAKNTEEWFSRNISGKTCSQAIRVWATLIQVNQDDSASVWWTAHTCIVFGKTIGRYSFKYVSEDKHQQTNYNLCLTIMNYERCLKNIIIFYSVIKIECICRGGSRISS